ncbi:hypothetical protein DL764_003823 [Monosporascus ibericus]|uniref:Uncharacterized protein n=1 Tax=Monosporascus ibericus TaxID=155417 RepID=A0A4Q4TFN2_9PEZI|nr:hypothetical protein DL764_003823 [Monosporascus ibericus]
MGQILKFNEHRAVANRDIFPDRRNHHVPPIVQSRTYDAGPKTDGSFGLVSTRGPHLIHVSRIEDELQRPDCFQSSSDEAYVTEFLQDQLDALSEDHNCWLQKGVAGLKASLETNAMASPILNLTLPACPVNITSAGNTFSIDFPTETYQIIGLATVILATITVCLYFVEKRIGRWHRTRKIVGYVDMFFCQAILLISGFALPGGIEDFGVMSLCGTNMISTSLAFSIGMIVAFIWNGAVAAMAVEWWLVRRASPDQPQSKIKMWMLKFFRQTS